ncbi:hypothetical protein MHTCC0001_30260 [Flavobacteriaceae bacterium MHTCC 0001]
MPNELTLNTQKIKGIVLDSYLTIDNIIGDTTVDPMIFHIPDNNSIVLPTTN